MNITVKILDTPQKSRKNVKLERDLFWYDSDHREMLKFRGRKLDISHKVFDTKLKRLVPKITDVFVPVNEKTISRNIVMDWLKQYSNYNTTQMEIVDQDSDGVLVSIPEQELDDIAYNMERHNIRFEVQ